MSRLARIAALVACCTACGEFSGTPREERARAADLTQAILDVTPDVHEFGLRLAPVGDLDGNGVIDVALSGDLVPVDLATLDAVRLPHWLLLLADDPDDPIKAVRPTNVGPEALARHPALRDAGRLSGLFSFETAAQPRLGHLLAADAHGRLLFLRLDEHGELLHVVAQPVRSVDPGLKLQQRFLGWGATIPDRNADGIPEVLAMISFTSATGEAESRPGLVMPSASANAASVAILDLPHAFDDYRIGSLQPAAFDEASGRLSVLTVITPELPADPDWGPTGRCSLISFELHPDGTVSEPVTVASSLRELLAAGDDVIPQSMFVQSSVDSLTGGGRSHMVTDWYPLGPDRWPTGIFLPDRPLPRRSGHELLGFDWDVVAGTARNPTTVASIDWRSRSGVFAAVAIEARDESGEFRRTGRLLVTASPGNPKGEPGLLAALSFGPVP